MKSVTAVAYPTIPIVFLGGINPNRVPLYNTMGLAVTSQTEETRTETQIEFSPGETLAIDFQLNGQRIAGIRGEQIISSIESFVNLSNYSGKFLIQSRNYEIFSGSSDSGLAALYTALNTVLELNYTKDELLLHAMKGSESAGRSLYGGLTLTKVDTDPLTVQQLASEKDLQSIRLFSVPFHYKSRLSADEIHSGIVTNPAFPERVKKIPLWISNIKKALARNDLVGVLTLAEENIRNAHELLEGIDLPVRKPEMMDLCNDIEQMREENLRVYFLIGGGNLITIATIEDDAKEVAKFLSKKEWDFYNFKVVSAPKIQLIE